MTSSVLNSTQNSLHRASSPHNRQTMSKIFTSIFSGHFEGGRVGTLFQSLKKLTERMGTPFSWLKCVDNALEFTCRPTCVLSSVNKRIRMNE